MLRHLSAAGQLLLVWLLGTGLALMAPLWASVWWSSSERGQQTLGKMGRGELRCQRWHETMSHGHLSLCYNALEQHVELGKYCLLWLKYKEQGYPVLVALIINCERQAGATTLALSSTYPPGWWPQCCHPPGSLTQHLPAQHHRQGLLW